MTVVRFCVLLTCYKNCILTSYRLPIRLQTSRSMDPSASQVQIQTLFAESKYSSASDIPHCIFLYSISSASLRLRLSVQLPCSSLRFVTLFSANGTHCSSASVPVVNMDLDLWFKAASGSLTQCLPALPYFHTNRGLSGPEKTLSEISERLRCQALFGKVYVCAGAVKIITIQHRRTPRRHLAIVVLYNCFPIFSNDVCQSENLKNADFLQTAT